MPMTCFLCEPPRRLPASTHREYLDSHYDRTHGHLGGLPDELTGPGQSWHDAAIAEAKRLAKTGAEFTIWQIAQAVGDPDNHKTKLGAFATELEHLGIARVVGYRRSDRPGTKGSAVAVWRGGTKPRQENAA